METLSSQVTTFEEDFDKEWAAQDEHMVVMKK